MEWTDDQRSAIDHIVEWFRGQSRFFTLSGPAGSGKTTILRALVPEFPFAVWAAMTGKAAARMRDVANVKAVTLHSALYGDPEEIDNIEARKIELNFDKVRGDKSSPLLIIDESSMITEKILRDIESSAYGKVLFVGDPYQIPPVEGDYSIFANIEGVALTKVMRTAGAVLRAAAHLRESDEIYATSEEDSGSRYEFRLTDSADDAFVGVLDDWFKDPDDHIILTWKNKTRMHVNRTIRARLGITNPMPQPGEYIVACENIHDKKIMNGDVVRLEEWLQSGPTFEGTDREGRPFKIESRWCRVRVNPDPNSADPDKNILVLLTGGEAGMFDGTRQYVGLENWRSAIRMAKNIGEDNQFVGARKAINFASPITYSYCLTVHKAQGSQYRRVTTYVPGDLRNRHFQKPTRLPDGREMAFSTRFLYTAISRAVKHSTLVVSP